MGEKNIVVAPTFKKKKKSPIFWARNFKRHVILQMLSRFSFLYKAKIHEKFNLRISEKLQ